MQMEPLKETVFNKEEEGAGEGKIPKMKIKTSDPDLADLNFDLPNGDGKPKAKGGKNRMSVERIYQKKTQLEHILLRPDTYIGSVEKLTQSMWVFDEDSEQMVQRDITFVPGLYKIFDEILVNAADNKQRDPKMNCIKIDLDPENNKIKIWNNGKGIPIIEHKTEKMYVPTMIFGHLLTSSNYDDSEKKVTGGRNGYGAKLCNIFSSKFTVETQCDEYKKAFRQTWQNNMGKSSEPKIASNKGEDYTCVTFYPDLEKFKMDCLDKDILDLFTRRAYDIAAASKGVKVFLNGKKLPVKNFKDYIDLYIKNKTDDTGAPLKLVYEAVSDRWEVAVTLSEKGFQQASFVNSIATYKGGRHVDYVSDQIINKLIETIKKKEKKGGLAIKPFQVRNHLWIFVNCLIENPTFDSQTKENMTLQAKSFGSKCPLSDKFVTNVSKCGIVESIQSWMKFKAQEKLNKKCGSTKHSKLKGVPKLDDANMAGTKNSTDCTLVLTEGDSAKAMAVAGLGMIGRDRYGVFPLRGKLLNVREATHKQIMENIEINNIIKIVGLRYKEKYDSHDSLKTLRYGKIMIMTDQDQDGSHIKGLLINFIHHNWPNLLRQGFLEEFITPIVKVSKKNQERSFYSLPEFEEWKRETDNWHTYKVKYYKGLGTSTSKEAKEYFADMQRHRIPFKYVGPEDDSSIVLAFSKKKIEERKEWLTNFMEERKRRAQLELPEQYLYGKETKSISYTDFVNRELILFSNMDNERSIPCLVDGLKPGQRKVMFACFKRNLIKEMKVAQLAGSVAELSAYHHGEMSLMMTIINLAQNFVGSNNINLLQPIGQFGTRLHGGKDAASPRYIFTALSTLARHLYNPHDEPLLKPNFDDSQRIEPEWYVPILPMILINGANGIGTGWSTMVPNYDVREIVANVRRMLDGDEPRPMIPNFKNFQGSIEELDQGRYVVNGEISVLDDGSVEITELPVRSWTQAYKESVLEPMLMGTEKTPPMIQDYKEYHTDTTVRFVVKMSPEKLAAAEEAGLHKVFKLQTTISNNMVLFDSNGCIRRFETPTDILKEYFQVRLDMYQRRKDYLEGMLTAESLKLDNQARFIMEKIEGTITIENKPKKELIQMLVRKGYDPDPVKSWKETQTKLLEGASQEEDNETEEASQGKESGPDFNYILSMALWCLTKEKVDEMIKNRDAKADELYRLRKKTPKDLYNDDLEKFMEELEKVETQEKIDDQAGVAAPVKAGKVGRAKPKKIFVQETKPSPMGRRVEPRIDPSLRARADAAKKQKDRAKVKKENNFEDLLDGDDDDEPKGLLARIGGVKSESGSVKSEPGQAKVKKPRKPKEPKDPFAEPKKRKSSGSPRGSLKGSPKKGGKGGKKRNPWSDSDEDSVGGGLSDSDDMENSFQELNVPSREKASRRAAAKPAKYVFEDDDVDGGLPPESDNEADFKPNTAAGIDDGAAEENGASDDSDFDAPSSKPTSTDLDSIFGKSSSKPAPKAPSPKKLTPVEEEDLPEIMDDSDEDDPIFPVEPAPKKEAPKKKTLGKKVTETKPKAKKGKADAAQPSIFDALTKPTTKKPKAKKTQVIIDSDDDDIQSIVSIDDSSQPSQTTEASQSTYQPSEASQRTDDSAPKKKAAPKRKKQSFDSDSDGDFGAIKKKPAAKKKAKTFDSDSDGDDSDFGVAKKKPAPKKRAPKKSGSDDDEGFMPKKKKTVATKKKKVASSDVDDDLAGELSDLDVAPRAPVAGGRSRKPVKYNFGEDDGEDDSDF